MSEIEYFGSHANDLKARRNGLPLCDTETSDCDGCGEQDACQPAMHIHIRLVGNLIPRAACSEGCAMKILARLGITSLEGITA